MLAIDSQIESRQGTGFRQHLGASIIGRPCARQIWYSFRWVKRQRHHARTLRLFDRGNLEEARFVRWLRQAGIHVVDTDPETGKQLRIEDHNGHFGGSLDAVLYDIPDLPGQWVEGEFKTHNLKSFNELKKHRVRKAKPEHFVQMQIYMHYMKLPAALYLAICKDDDELYTEVVEYMPEVALFYIDRARKIIDSPNPPERVQNASPGFFICRMCDYEGICWDNDPIEMNCRTCVNSVPANEGLWHCRRYDYPLNEQDQKRGCRDHTPIAA